MLIKRLTKKALLLSKIGRILDKMGKQGLIILRYHSVLNNPCDFEIEIGRGIIHSADSFLNHMKIVANEFHPITMDEVYKFVKGQNLPRRSIAITFDDGFSDNAEIAAPIMDEYSIKGAFYVTTGAIGSEIPPWFIRLRHAFAKTKINKWIGIFDNKNYYLDKVANKYEAFIHASQNCARLCGLDQQKLIDRIEYELEVTYPIKNGGYIMSSEQIKSLQARGHTIGSHTVSHPNIAHIDNDSALAELVDSKNKLEAVLSSKVEHFAYPSPILQPHWNELTIELARKAGYLTSVTCTPGAVRQKDCPLSLKRIAIPEDSIEFKWNIETVLAGMRAR